MKSIAILKLSRIYSYYLISQYLLFHIVLTYGNVSFTHINFVIYTSDIHTFGREPSQKSCLVRTKLSNRFQSLIAEFTSPEMSDSLVREFRIRSGSCPVPKVSSSTIMLNLALKFNLNCFPHSYCVADIKSPVNCKTNRSVFMTKTDKIIC